MNGYLKKRMLLSYRTLSILSHMLAWALRLENRRAASALSLRSAPCHKPPMACCDTWFPLHYKYSVYRLLWFASVMTEDMRDWAWDLKLTRNLHQNTAFVFKVLLWFIELIMRIYGSSQALSYKHTHTHKHIHTNTYTQTHKHTHTHTHTTHPTHKNNLIHTHTHTNARTHTHTHTHTHTYIHTHSHTYTHRHTHTLAHAG